MQTPYFKRYVQAMRESDDLEALKNCLQIRIDFTPELQDHRDFIMRNFTGDCSTCAYIARAEVTTVLMWIKRAKVEHAPRFTRMDEAPDPGYDEESLAMMLAEPDDGRERYYKFRRGRPDWLVNDAWGKNLEQA